MGRIANTLKQGSSDSEAIDNTVLTHWEFCQSPYFSQLPQITAVLLENSSSDSMDSNRACADRRVCENMSLVKQPLLTTLQVAFGALFIAVPLGVGCAIYL